MTPAIRRSVLNVDKDFDIEGWVIKDSIAGPLDVKSFEKEGTGLKTLPVINTHVKNEWKLVRRTSIASIKSFIPLYILLFLCWYSSFLDYSESTTAVGLNTTVFLAGIALYFSAERPDTSVLTIIDKIFIFFYCSIALLIASEFSMFFGENVYSVVHYFWQISIPIVVIASFIFLFYKRKAVSKK